MTISSGPERPTAGAGNIGVVAPIDGPLKGASINRLACLVRHWMWADDAKARFDDQLVRGWALDDDPIADHLFGAYYQWTALLCGFSEAVLEHGLMSASQLQTLRPDLEACLPEMRASRQLLVVIPDSREDHPRIGDLLRDDQTLGRLRRIHLAFGQVLRIEQASRAIDFPDVQER